MVAKFLQTGGEALSSRWCDEDDLAHIEDDIAIGAIPMEKQRVAYALSMHEETVSGAHVMHIMATEPFEIDKISRKTGDAYCKPRYKFYELLDEGTGTPTCPRCIRIAEKLEQSAIEKTIAMAVWSRQIDQISTKEVADEYGIEQRQALRILKKIKEGKVTDPPFVFDEDRQGVAVADGSIFTYSPMDIDGNAMSLDGSPKHYIWFCS